MQLVAWGVAFVEGFCGTFLLFQVNIYSSVKWTELILAISSCCFCVFHIVESVVLFPYYGVEDVRDVQIPCDAAQQASDRTNGSSVRLKSPSRLATSVLLSALVAKFISAATMFCSVMALWMLVSGFKLQTSGFFELFCVASMVSIVVWVGFVCCGYESSSFYAAQSIVGASSLIVMDV